MKSHKIIVFYLPSAEPRSTPYIWEKTPKRHDDFISHFPDNVVFYLATHKSEYLGNDTFSPKYKREKNIWIEGIHKNIQPDLILGMTRRIECTKKYHNPIRDFCIDKTKIESVFPDISFSSYVCTSYEDIKENFWNIPTSKKVLKPAGWSQGKWIIISDERPEKKEITGEYPYLLQEFIDTSNGFEWYKGVHDFRTIIINGEITGAFLRVAPKWVLTANVCTGANIIDFWKDKIPPRVLAVIEKIEAYCSEKYPQRYYSIDVWIWHNNEVKVFELNASPALSTPSIRKYLALHIIKNILKLS